MLMYNLASLGSVLYWCSFTFTPENFEKII